VQVYDATHLTLFTTC